MAMKGGIIRAIGIPVLLVLGGCDQTTPATANTAIQKPRARAQNVVHYPTHRFVQESFNPGVAFDTQTGQICRTWAWSPMGKAPKEDPATGGSPERMLGEYSPTCIDVYNTYRSQVGQDNDEEK